MAQAMHTRSRGALGNGEAKLRHQFLKDVTDRGGMDRLGLAERKQRRRRREWAAVMIQQIEIAKDELAPSVARRVPQSTLTEFCLAHHQQLARPVDIADAESGDFSDAHSQAIEQ